MLTLEKQGISRRHIRAAIDAFRAGGMVPARLLSRNTYLLDPEDYTLWDLKAVVARASDLAVSGGSGHPSMDSGQFNTRRYIPELLRLGFPILRFEVLAARSLGLRGHDPAALCESHVLLEPPNGAERLDALMPVPTSVAASEPALGPPPKVDVADRRFLRNSELVRKVLSGAAGICACCGGRAFQTPGGDWYLEVHHKKWLSEGGPDALENMIALCPNCHAREHRGTERKYH